MPFSTYAELQDAIVRWAIRTGDTEFTAQVPDFIDLAETRFNRTLRVRGMEAVASLTPDGAGVLSLPADYLEFRSLGTGINGYSELEMVAPGAEIGEYHGGGVGRRFSISGGAIQTYPSANGAIALSYYAKVPALSDANPTNWLLTEAPDLYLYGSLLEAAPYMEDDARAQVWLTYFERAMADLRSNDASARYAGGVARVRSYRP